WMSSFIFIGSIFGYGVAYFKCSHDAREMQLLYINQYMSDRLEALSLLRNGDIAATIDLMEVTLQATINGSYTLVENEKIESENLDEHLLKDFLETYSRAQAYSEKYI